MRAKADEAMEAAKRASQDRETQRQPKLPMPSSWRHKALRGPQNARPNCSGWNSWPSRAAGPQRGASLPSTPTHQPRIFGKRRMLRAFPKLKHGAQNRSLDTLREQLKRK